MKIWIDITNTPQVHFLLAIHKMLENSEREFQFTVRDFSETIKLMEQKTKEPFSIFGGHTKGNLAKKAFSVAKRTLSIGQFTKGIHASISCGSEAAIWNCFLRGIPTIAFGDNDLAKQWTYGRFVKHVFFPECISPEILIRQGINANKIISYPGYKEHIYLAHFKPNPNFLERLPFRDYVVVRPENLRANYVNGDFAQSITPELLRSLSEAGRNILYLPRYEEDRNYAKGITSIYIPNEPINGLDASYFSQGVFTGAGTFAREAACLGIPSFSFFAGNDLLQVDKDLIAKGQMFHSRNAQLLMERFELTAPKSADLSAAKNTYNFVQQHLENIFQQWH